MRLRHPLTLTALAILALGVAACGSSKSSSSSSGGGATLNGAGSTFAAPIYQQFGSDLKSQGITINYNPVGSGQGVAELIAGTVNFAGSDPPMKPDEIKQAEKRGMPVHFPVAFGAITVSYNLSGVKSGLKLDGKTLGDMFLGKIKKWDDPAIAALNPGVKLPSDAITIVHRSEDSGTTKGFTAFMSAYNPEWNSKVGSDKSVKWPTGTGANGNQGVASAIKQTPGAVGYVEQAYALQNKFTTADVKNKAGKFVAPDLASTSAAGAGVKVPASLQFTIIDSPNPTAYPIASQTFVIVYKDLCKGGKLSSSGASAMVKLLNYALGPGQDVAKKLSYAPLPAPIDSAAKKQVVTLTCNGSAVK